MDLRGLYYKRGSFINGSVSFKPKKQTRYALNLVLYGTDSLDYVSIRGYESEQAQNEMPNFQKKVIRTDFSPAFTRGEVLIAKVFEVTSEC
jgi:hypothetical protein